MATLKIVLKNNKKRANGTYPLALRITHKGRSKYIFLKEFVKAEEWDSIAERVTKTVRNRSLLNNILAKRKLEVDNVILEFERRSDSYSVDDILNKLNSADKELYFDDLAEEMISKMGRQNSMNYRDTEFFRLNIIKRYNKNKKIKLGDLTESYLMKFVEHFKNVDVKSPNTIHKYVSLMQRVYRRALREEIIKGSDRHFERVLATIKKQPTEKVYLSIDEIQKIHDLELNEDSTINDVRNIWLFSFYLAGMRVGDLISLKWSMIIGERLYYSMKKNNKPDYVKIANQALEILKFYRSNGTFDKDEYVFPYLKGKLIVTEKDLHVKIRNANRLYNDYLKKIAELAGIDKNLSMHIARHSFANYAVEMELPILDVQKLLRHSDVRTTYRYLAPFMKKGSDKAIDRLFGNKKSKLGS